jgi:hypothetical protein
MAGERNTKAPLLLLSCVSGDYVILVWLKTLEIIMA